MNPTTALFVHTRIVVMRIVVIVFQHSSTKGTYVHWHSEKWTEHPQSSNQKVDDRGVFTKDDGVSSTAAGFFMVNQCVFQNKINRCASNDFGWWWNQELQILEDPND